MSAFGAIMARDLTLAIRAGGGAAHAVLFFSLCGLLFGLAIGPEREALAKVAAPALWTAALLATVISLDRIFHSDFEDGSLDALVETSEFLELTVLAKAAAHWLTACLPLMAAAPLVGLLLNLPGESYGRLLASLAAGTPALSLIGAAASAAAMGLRRANLLVALVVMPLLAPSLIFGVIACSDGPDAGPSLMILCGLSLFAVVAGPLAGAAAIRFNLD
jgi:heme exporter protein B